MCTRSVVISWNKDSSKRKDPEPYQHNSAFLFEDENGNFLLLLAATLNLTTISHCWNISKKEIILCGDRLFRGFGKASGWIISMLHLQNQVFLERNWVTLTWIVQTKYWYLLYQLGLYCLHVWDNIQFSSDAVTAIRLHLIVCYCFRINRSNFCSL